MRLAYPAVRQRRDREQSSREPEPALERPALDYRASGTCASNVCTATVSADKYSVTYNNGNNGQRLSYAGLDLIVGLARSANVVTVSNAYNHGLNVGDKIKVTQTLGSGTFGVSQRIHHPGRGL